MVIVVRKGVEDPVLRCKDAEQLRTLKVGCQGMGAGGGEHRSPADSSLVRYS